MNTPALPNHPTKAARRLPAAGIALLVLIVAAVAFLLGRQDWGSPSLSFTNGVRGSGVAATQTRSLPSFRAVDLAGASTLTVHAGAKQTVVVNADDNVINRVKTDVRDGVLVVSERGSFAPSLPLAVEITVPNLDSTRLMGSGAISVDGVQARKFTAEVLGSGMLTISGTVDHLNARSGWSGKHAARRPHCPFRHSRSARLRAPRSARHRHPRRIDPGQRKHRLQRPPNNAQADDQRLGLNPAGLKTFTAAQTTVAPQLTPARGSRTG